VSIIWVKVLKPEVGHRSRFAVPVEDRTFTHLWEVTEAIPNQKLSYKWRYEEYPGDSFVTFELEEKEGGVNLRLSLNVTESFPDNIPEFKRESCINGWDYFLGQNLKKYLEGNSK